MKFIEGGITKPKGFKASGVYCGLRKNKSKKDLGLIYSETICNAVAVYTTNKVQGAPIAVTKNNLKDGKAQAVIVNSGNANTCNADGVEKAEKMCGFISKALHIPAENIIVASTGVIGQPLDIDAIESGIPDLVQQLSPQGSEDASEAILTTDLVKKEFAIEFEVGGKTVCIGMISKGSGMIHPNMATLLSFATTDVKITDALLDEAFREAINYSLNRVSVDGDTSTNDMACIMANGLAGNPVIESKNEDYATFLKALKLILLETAKSIAKDGEGATKLIECIVENFKTEAQSVQLAKSVIMSNLVKSAIFGNDANWGRVLCALGYAGVDFDEKKVDVLFKSTAGEILVCKDGSSVDFDEDLATKILSQDRVVIAIDMKQGATSAFAFGCDLTYEYVKINGSYRS